MAETIRCHYARAHMYQLHKNKKLTLNERHRAFTQFFGCDMSKEKFARSSQRLAALMQRRWRAKSVAEYLNMFRLESWRKLRTGEKDRHSVEDCNGCWSKQEWNACFPLQSTRGAYRKVPVQTLQ
eukprot:scpid80733/ scgid26034/ 